MKKPKLRLYLKARFQHPFKSLRDLIYTDDSGNRYQEYFSPQAAIINVAAVLLAVISVIFLNCTIWYVLLMVIVLYVLRYLRYFYANFSVTDENNNPVGERKAYSHSKKLLFTTEVIFVLLVAIGAYYLFSTSLYARVVLYNKIDIGETYLHLTDQEIESFEQAYKESIKFAKANVPSAYLTDYGIQIHTF